MEERAKYDAGGDNVYAKAADGRSMAELVAAILGRPELKEKDFDFFLRPWLAGDALDEAIRATGLTIEERHRLLAVIELGKRYLGAKNGIFRVSGQGQGGEDEIQRTAAT